MKIGYARVSRQEQNLDRQLHALKDEGCERIFIDRDKRDKEHRPEFEKMMQQLREGDMVVVFELDRLSGSMIQSVKYAERLKALKVDLLNLHPRFDTSTQLGKMFFYFASIFSEMELSKIRKRTRQGLAVAKELGRKGGRPPGLNKEAIKKARACKAMKKDNMSNREIARSLGISPTTVGNYLKVKL